MASANNKFEHMSLPSVRLSKDKSFKNFSHTRTELRDHITDKVNAIFVIKLFKDSENVFNSVLILWYCWRHYLGYIIFQTRTIKWSLLTNPNQVKYKDKTSKLYPLFIINLLSLFCHTQYEDLEVSLIV